MRWYNLIIKGEGGERKLSNNSFLNRKLKIYSMERRNKGKLYSGQKQNFSQVIMFNITMLSHADSMQP